MPRILIVEDDNDTRTLTASAFKKYLPLAHLYTMSNGQGFFHAVALYKPHLIILDWVLGNGRNGLSLCQKLKSLPSGRKIPVILVTGQHLKNKDELQSIAHGADIYMTKPFSLKTLISYSKALLKRWTKLNTPPNTLRLGPLILDQHSRQIFSRHHGLKQLPDKLFGVLWLLAKHSPHVVTTKHLIRYVWRNQVKDNEAAVAISRLKPYLNAQDCSIESIAGEGYRLMVPDD